MMNTLLHLVILLLCYGGLTMYNRQGAFTVEAKHKIVGSLLHLTAISITMMLYGTMRGIFVYTGLVVLFGMVYTLCNNNAKPH